MTKKENEIKELDGDFTAKKDALENQQKEEVKDLKKKIDTMEAKLTGVKSENQKAEMKLRDEYRRNDRLYDTNIQTYDVEMRDKMR
jgi:chromosome segregation ATPase